MGEVEEIFKENAIEFITGEKTATITASQVKLRNSLKRLAEERKEVKLMVENADGSCVFRVPASWVKVSPPRTMTMTEEQRAEKSEQMKRLAAARKGGKHSANHDKK